MKQSIFRKTRFAKKTGLNSFEVGNVKKLDEKITNIHCKAHSKQGSPLTQ
jgi:hypothetical protein